MASSIRTRPDIDTLWDRYTCLPPGPKTVLRLKSLVFLASNKSVFFDCISRAGLRTPEGRAWTVAAVNPALELLRREDLLDVDHACPLALLHPVAIDAVTSPEGERLVAAVRRAFPPQLAGMYHLSQSMTDPAPILRLARLAVYANDEAGFIAHCNQHDSAFAPQRLTTALGWVLHQAPLAADWIDSRAPTIQQALFEGRVSAFLANGQAIPGLPDLIARYRGQDDRPGFAQVRRTLLEHDLLTLRLDGARGLLPKLDEADAMLRQTAAATLCFLAGENAEAVSLYRAVLKERRKQAGKRKLFLEGAHGLFFLMALLRANDAAVHAEIEAGGEIFARAREDADPHFRRRVEPFGGKLQLPPHGRVDGIGLARPVERDAADAAI